MTTNVADYIAENVPHNTRSPGHWPEDNLADGWRVGVFYTGYQWNLYFNDRDSNHDLYIVLRYNKGPLLIYVKDRFSMPKEEFLDHLKDNFPIAFEWCLFNLDLIGV